MAFPQSLTDALAKIDTDTNSLASVVQGLRDKISTGMSQADVDLVHGKLGEISTRLQGIAADPAVPVPPEPTPEPLA